MPSVDIHYHFFPPDDVVSARHFGDLAEGLVQLGWKVRVFCSNRSCRANGASYPLRETINGVDYYRTWRPDFPQSKTYGRILNALWMIIAWGSRPIWELDPPDVIITGTDPILSVTASLPWKWTYAKTKQVHWCFDLYPDAIVAEGLLKQNSLPEKILKSITQVSLRNQDVLSNLGPCMEGRLETHGPGVDQLTITPWALVEPKTQPAVDKKIRKELFGEANLGLLYSGSFGRAHSYEDILSLARVLRGESICFCFAVRGNRVDQLKAAINPSDINIKFVGFASEEELEARLASADIHIASLHTEWTGCVVPSKFFGSLAIGRPVLFAGANHASPAIWNDSERVGWNLNNNNIKEIAGVLRYLSCNHEDLKKTQQRAFEIYKNKFSKNKNIERLNKKLLDLLK